MSLQFARIESLRAHYGVFVSTSITFVHNAYRIERGEARESAEINIYLSR